LDVKGQSENLIDILSVFEKNDKTYMIVLPKYDYDAEKYFKSKGNNLKMA